MVYRDSLCLQGLYLEPRNSEIHARECAQECVKCGKMIAGHRCRVPSDAGSLPRVPVNHMILSLVSGTLSEFL